MKHFFFVGNIFLLGILFFLTPSFASKEHDHGHRKEHKQEKGRHEGHTGHKHSQKHSMKSKISDNKILSPEDIKIFIKAFNPVEKELNKLKLSQFRDIESFSKPLKQSREIRELLKREKISAEKYIEVFKSLTSAYNELKMARFEERIRKNQHEKFVPREELMLDHQSEDHQKLHEMQAESFSESFDPEGLGGDIREPKENIALIQKYEEVLDKIFKN